MVPQNYVKIFVFWYRKHWHPRLSSSKKLILGVVHLGDSGGVSLNYVKLFAC